jgi:hypothetical protein
MQEKFQEFGNTGRKVKNASAVEIRQIYFKIVAPCKAVIIPNEWLK